MAEVRDVLLPGVDESEIRSVARDGLKILLVSSEREPGDYMRVCEGLLKEGEDGEINFQKDGSEDLSPLKDWREIQILDIPGRSLRSGKCIEQRLVCYPNQEDISAIKLGSLQGSEVLKLWDHKGQLLASEGRLSLIGDNEVICKITQFGGSIVLQEGEIQPGWEEIQLLVGFSREAAKQIIEERNQSYTGG